jgi:hypothetical protein
VVRERKTAKDKKLLLSVKRKNGMHGWPQVELLEKVTAHALIFQAPGFQAWFPKL